MLQQCVRLDPEHALGWNDLGSVCLMLGDLKAAVDALRHATHLQPGLQIAHANLGLALYHLGSLEEAQAACGRALEIDPANDATRWTLSMCHLALGKMHSGWQLYQSRWSLSHTANFRPRDFFDKPCWLGEGDPAGQAILVHAEQGFGDTLQFCRYVLLLQQRGARVLLEVQPAMLGLLSRAFAPAVSVLGRGQPLPKFDMHCPLMSLPLAFRTDLDNIPAASPYLWPNVDSVSHWRKKLGGSALPRIALAWSGGRLHPRDGARSMPLRELLALDRFAANYFAAQTELRESDSAALKQFSRLAWYGPELREFDDTASLLALCDLVITVDTSVAHLAGALGRRTWLLLPFAADWRWLLRRQDSPWYPTMRLFRQNRMGDWSGVVAEVANALAQEFGPPAATPFAVQSSGSGVRHETTL